MNAPGPVSKLEVPFGGSALVSVILPTLNRREPLLRAVRSVLDQSYSNLELIVVDDGSTDGTDAAIGALSDPRIRYVRQDQTCGAGVARHTGAGLSQGRYVAYLDSDDYWLGDKLRRQLAVAETHAAEEVVVIAAPHAYRCEGGLYLGPTLPPIDGRRMADYIYTAPGATVITSGLLISGELARRVRFDPLLRSNQDTDLVLRLEKAGARFLGIEEGLYVHDASPRTDRISFDPGVVDASLRWFEAVSGDWPESARRGYFFFDYAIRSARAGRRAAGIAAVFRGYHRPMGGYMFCRQLLRAIGGGEVPALLRRRPTLPAGDA